MDKELQTELYQELKFLRDRLKVKYAQNGRNAIVCTDEALQEMARLAPKTLEEGAEFNVDDEDFEIFKKFHLATCERTDMQGIANHLLFICKKL